MARKQSGIWTRPRREATKVGMAYSETKPLAYLSSMRQRAQQELQAIQADANPTTEEV